MTYVRKTRDVFVIQGHYSSAFGWEDLSQYDDRREAREDLKAYRENEPEYGHRLITRRERIDD